MRHSTKRLVSSVTALLFVVLAFIVFFNFVEPAYREVQQVRGELVSRQIFLESQQKVIQQVQGLISTYEGEGELQQTVSFALPLAPDVAGALAQLSGLLSVNGLSAQSFSISIPAVQVLSSGPERRPGAELARPVGTLTFQTRVVGAYENVKSFLRNLETNIRIFDVRNVAFQPAAKSNQDLYAVDLSVVAYYQNP